LTVTLPAQVYFSNPKLSTYFIISSLSVELTCSI